MKWRGIEREQFFSQVAEQLIRVLECVAGSREKRGFVSAGVTNEEITREFLWSNDRVGRLPNRSVLLRHAAFRRAVLE